MTFDVLLISSTCLSDGSYTADLTLGELYEYQEAYSEQVVAEFADCVHLLYDGEESYSFDVVDGACDYCQGEHEFEVELTGTPGSSAQRTLWTVFSLNSSMFG